MKKAVRLFSILLAVTALVSAMSVSAHAITDARSALPSEPKTIKLEDVEGAYKELVKKALGIDGDMTMIELDEMPDEVEVKYMQAPHGYGAKIYRTPKGENKLAQPADGTEVYVYYYLGGYALIETEDGHVGWCQASYLSDTFDADLSAKNRRLYDGKMGLYG